jgi:Soluble NSF attachment protein, SNAP
MPLTPWIETHRDRLRAFCEAPGRPLFVLEAPPEMTALAARVVASLEADDLSEEMIFGYSAPFPEGADPNAWYEGIAAAVEANLDEQRPILEEAGVALPVTMGLDRWCAAPGVTCAHLVADYLDRVARLAQRHTRRVMVVLHAENAAPERAIALARAFAACVGGDRVKVLCLVESATALDDLSASLAPIASSRRLQVEAAELMLHDARASIDELVTSPTRRVLSLVGEASQLAAALHAPQVVGRDARVRPAHLAVPCGQPMTFTRAAVARLAALRAAHLGETFDLSALDDVADPNLGPEGVLADFAERVARVVCRDDQVLLVVVEPAPLEDASLYGASMVSLAAAAASPRVRWVLLDPSHGGALPVLTERDRPVLHARLEVTPDAMEDGVRARLADASLPPLERFRFTLVLAGFALSRRDFDHALALQDGAVGMARAMNSPAEEATAFLSVGHTLYSDHQWAEARKAFSRATELALDAERDPLAAQGLTNLGHTQLCAGEAAEAESCYRTAGEWFERMGAPLQAAHALTWLGESQRRQTRFNEAEATWRDVVARYDALGPDFAAATRVGRAEVIERLARMRAELGQHDAAAQWRSTQHEGVEVPPVMEQP